MSVRTEPPAGLTTRQKLAMFYGTGVPASEVLSMDEEDITFDLMIRNGVKAVNLTAAGIKVITLKKLGVEQASQLRRLGFDALHLVDEKWCADACAAYGASNIISAFLVAPQDAVALSGSEAMKTLNISVNTLLELCAGAPTEAVAVLKQAPDPNPLKDVHSSVLLDTGVRSQQLKKLGYNLFNLNQMSGLTPEDIGKLGFTC